MAVILNNKLLIHGGFNGAECLADLWQLDLATWQWTQLQTKVPLWLALARSAGDRMP